jgi:hypothetical protein
VTPGARSCTGPYAPTVPETLPQVGLCRVEPARAGLAADGAFKNGLKLYVYPHRPTLDDELRTVNDIKVQPDLQPLYDYLYGRGSFVHLDNYRPECLPIFSRDVLRRIAAQDDS